MTSISIAFFHSCGTPRLHGQLALRAIAAARVDDGRAEQFARAVRRVALQERVRQHLHEPGGSNAFPGLPGIQVERVAVERLPGKEVRQ